MGLQKIAAKLLWFVVPMSIVCIIGFIVHLVQLVAAGRGLEMFRGGRRMLPLLPVAVLIKIGVIAVVLVIAAIVSWYQRKYGWSDDDGPQP